MMRLFNIGNRSTSQAIQQLRDTAKERIEASAQNAKAMIDITTGYVGTAVPRIREARDAARETMTIVRDRRTVLHDAKDAVFSAAATIRDVLVATVDIPPKRLLFQQEAQQQEMNRANQANQANQANH